ncbi:COX15/CtaA family protein [Solitalea sp. MAHUQ-68]|uniref:COX15/CtaA family protein n=1 Tax=Solitalea agri TaxID=2953739 RepID=A0A9X2JDB6_9SPHI|nr:COX15/CtaA family protein [Solitalea agri]MCO4293454.1 COX15/CtaA family protein [Solitalea agri]
MQNKSEKKFLSVCFTAILLTFLVIIAGGVVRSTGSGMGCPDWPKCFGHYIPPTTINELTFSEGKFFKKGYIVIWNEALYKAKQDFTTGKEFVPSDWEKYTKHSYAKFNVYHTWTEYVNRLTGVLLGFGAIATVVFAIRYLKTNKRKVFWLSLFNLFLIGYQGWLGSKVVESNLKAYMVTIHMFVALIILALYIYIYEQARARKFALADFEVANMKRIKVGAFVLMTLTMVQMLLGTQVREIIDEIAAVLNQTGREQWVSRVGFIFLSHRELAIAVLVLTVVLFVWIRKVTDNTFVQVFNYNSLLVVLQIITGIVLAWMALPPVFQALHLVFGCLMFGLQFWTVLFLLKIKATSSVAVKV